MAKLTTPIVPRITTFDPAVDMTVDFLYTGNQINRNRAVVIDTSTYQTVYDNEQYRMRLDHVFPKGTFTPGKSYQIKIKVFDVQALEHFDLLNRRNFEGRFCPKGRNTT